MPTKKQSVVLGKSAKSIEALNRKPKSCKITEIDARAIAELVATRLTEKEACLLLYIDYNAWQNWKSRHKDSAIYSESISRVRAASVRAHLDNIRSAGFGQNGHRADWRASDRYLERIDPARFNDRLANMGQPETDALADSLLAKMLARAYADRPQDSAVVSTDSAPKDAPAKQLASNRDDSAEVIEVKALEQ